LGGGVLVERIILIVILSLHIDPAVFLQQFGVSSGVLNCELPLESRWHAIQAFNKGLFDVLIATDDPKLMSSRGAAAQADAAAVTSAGAGSRLDI